MDISVIIPTYNRADVIADTLHSVLAQSHRPSEVIVVDDGSTDNTEAIVRSVGRQVRYTRIENSGVCRARNVGVQLSHAPYLAFCDSDDLWSPEKLHLQARSFEAEPEAKWSFTNFRTVVENKWTVTTKFSSSPLGYWNLQRRDLDENSFVVDIPLFERLLLHQPVFPSTILVSREFFEKIGGWIDRLGRTPSEDLEFILRCARHCPVGVISAAVVGIRKHASNFSGNWLKTTLGEIEILRHVLEHHRINDSETRAVHDQIVLRSARASAESLRIGEIAQARELLRSVPILRRSWKLHLKRALMVGRRQ